MEIAKNLVVRVIKNGRVTVHVTLPANCAYWFIDFIPKEIVSKISQSNVSLEKIQEALKQQKQLNPQLIFEQEDEHRNIQISLV